jgi:hypothetical protein
MTTSRLRQALKYQLNNVGWSSLYLYGIAVVAIIAIGSMITINASDGNVGISGIGGVGFVHFLVIGIAGIREDLRFFAQHGIGRRTTFFCHFFGSLICSTALGLFREIFYLIAHYWLGFTFYDSALTIQAFLSSWATYMFVFFFAWRVGALIGLV